MKLKVTKSKSYKIKQITVDKIKMKVDEEFFKKYKKLLYKSEMKHF